MMLTEEQYKEKWCPEARRGMMAGALISVGVNLSNDGSPAGNCIGSDCAMWRWGRTTCTHKKANMNLSNVNKVKIECDCQPKGYCGLAGKP